MPVRMPTMKQRYTSRLRAFYRQTVSERIHTLEKETSLDIGESLSIGLPLDLANKMVENTVGIMGLPLGVATNFEVNGTEVLVPMAIEEPSVIAAAANAARMSRFGTGFTATMDPALMDVQIEILDPAPGGAAKVNAASKEILAKANDTQKELVALGGGATSITVREAVGSSSRMVVHLTVDCKDAMGANSVNTMAEAVSDEIASLAGGRPGLRILTNLADKRLVHVSTKIPFDGMKRGRYPGDSVSRGVVNAYEFAAADPYRAATHNKGIFNGIDAVLIATGNDWRAVEAGGHAFAAMGPHGYGPLTQWSIEDEHLVGKLEMPMAVGIVGGAARTHPVARMCLALMGVEKVSDLACIVGAVGLATNLAALAALSSEGIQFGHMRLHARKQGS